MLITFILALLLPINSLNLFRTSIKFKQLMSSQMILFSNKLPWSDKDLDFLIDLKRQTNDWTKISSRLNRTVNACKSRYNLLISSHIWSKDSQRTLLDYVTKYGENWHLIEDMFRNKYNQTILSETCKLYYYQLIRDFEVGPWNDEEIKYLGKLYDENLIYIDNDKAGTFYSLKIPNWRNISHYVHRSSIDCRKQHITSFLKRDLSRLPDVWYEAEIYRLRQLYLLNPNQWSLIGREMGRTSSQCYTAFQHLSLKTTKTDLSSFTNHSNISNTSNHSNNNTNTNTNIVASFQFWDASEDQMLLDLAKKYGSKWKLIGSQLGRTSNSCFQRYQILQVQGGPVGWTQHQTDHLRTLVTEYGPKWTMIAKQLNRTAYTCRAAYKRLLERKSSTSCIDAMMTMPRKSDEKVSFENIRLEPTTSFWDTESDEILKSKVIKYGRKWSIIAEDMGRSPEDVMLRYDFKIMRKRSGSWTQREDRQLLEIVKEIGPRWSQIATLMGRTRAQCSLRYRFSLDPRLKWRLWTPEEDEQLIQLRDKMGYNWGMISATMDRAGTSCRYRYGRLKSDK